MHAMPTWPTTSVARRRSGRPRSSVEDPASRRPPTAERARRTTDDVGRVAKTFVRHDSVLPLNSHRPQTLCVRCATPGRPTGRARGVGARVVLTIRTRIVVVPLAQVGQRRLGRDLDRDPRRGGSDRHGDQRHVRIPGDAVAGRARRVGPHFSAVRRHVGSAHRRRSVGRRRHLPRFRGGGGCHDCMPSGCSTGRLGFESLPEQLQREQQFER